MENFAAEMSKPGGEALGSECSKDLSELQGDEPMAPAATDEQVKAATETLDNQALVQDAVKAKRAAAIHTEVKKMLPAEINLSLEQQIRVRFLIEAAQDFTATMLLYTPKGPDQSAALRKIREAVWTATQAVGLAPPAEAQSSALDLPEKVEAPNT